MGNAEQLLQIYQIGRIASAVICVLALALAVYLFFKFDIRMIHAIRTGRAQELSEKRGKDKQQKAEAPEKKVDLDFTTDTLKPKRRTEGKKNKTAAPLETMPLAAKSTDLGAAYGIKFVLSEETVLIHTDETV